MKESAKASPKPAVLSLAQLLAEQPAAPPPGWIEPGLLPPSGILFVGGEPKVGKSLLVANLALALAAGKDRAGFTIPAAAACAGLPVRTAHAAVCGAAGDDAPLPGRGRRPEPAGGYACRRQSAERPAGTQSLSQRRPSGCRRGDRARPFVLDSRSGRKRYPLHGGAVPEPVAATRCFQGRAHRRASRAQIDRPRRDRQRLPRFLGAARRGRLLPAAHAPLGPSRRHRRVALPVSLRRGLCASLAATRSADAVLFRRWGGAHPALR